MDVSVPAAAKTVLLGTAGETVTVAASRARVYVEARHEGEAGIVNTAAPATGSRA